MWRQLFSYRVRSGRLLIAALLLHLLLTALSSPLPVSAHPLGNFSVNRYSRMLVGPDLIQLHYVLDMAEIPTFQRWPDIDRDEDGAVGPAENDSYRQALLEGIQESLLLQLDGRRLALTLLDSVVTFPPGQGDLPTLRLEADFSAELPQSRPEWRIGYTDSNFAGRPGWQEVVVQPAAGVTLLESTAPSRDLSNGLLAYPEDLLQSPPAINAVTFVAIPYSAGQAATVNNAAPPAAGALPAAGRFGGDELADRFVALAALPDPTPGVLALALLVAAGLGALHALSPGHGKAVVGAYLVGSRGTARHALFLGLTTTITHTAGVFAFGLIVLAAAQFIQPELLYPWLGVLSGVLVAAIGLSLFRQRWSAFRGHPRHSHNHAHEHGHSHEHVLTHGSEHRHEQPGDHQHHRHVDHPHHHDPPGEVTWRSLLALGVSGGLLPCPSALVLLLSAIALGRVALGLVLIVAFSLGLAGVLTMVGLILVYAGRMIERSPIRGGRLIKLIPLAGAIFVAIAGALVALQALFQIGVL